VRALNLSRIHGGFIAFYLEPIREVFQAPSRRHAILAAGKKAGWEE